MDSNITIRPYKLSNSQGCRHLQTDTGKQLFVALYYSELSTDIILKIMRLKPVLLDPFVIRRKLSVLRYNT